MTAVPGTTGPSLLNADYSNCHCQLSVTSVTCINQGPDLQNIIRQSYDKVMTMTEVMTNHTTDAIYKKSYDKVMINL